MSQIFKFPRQHFENADVDFMIFFQNHCIGLPNTPLDAEFYALFRFRTSGVDLCNLCEYDRVVIEKTGFEVLTLTPTRGYASFKWWYVLQRSGGIWYILPHPQTGQGFWSILIDSKAI